MTNTININTLINGPVSTELLLSFPSAQIPIRINAPADATVIRLNGIFDVVEQVFVMEDGSTRFVNEDDNTTTFKPE
jgi:hypothetical protein